MAKLTGWGYPPNSSSVIVPKMFPPYGRNGCTISLRRWGGTGWGCRIWINSSWFSGGLLTALFEGSARAAGLPSSIRTRGRGSNKNACPAQECPWLMCSHRKWNGPNATWLGQGAENQTCWTKSCRPVAKAAAQLSEGIREHLGSVWNILIRSYDFKESAAVGASFCLSLRKWLILACIQQLPSFFVLFCFFYIIYRIRNRDRQSFGARKRWLCVSQLSLLWLQHAHCGTMCGLVNDCFMCCFTEAAQLVVWKDIFLLWEYIFNRSWKPQTWPWFQNSCTNFVKEPHTLTQKHIFIFWGCLLLSFCLLAPFCSMSWCERGKYLGKYVAVFRVYLGSPGQKQKVFKMLALLFRYWQFKNNPRSQPFRFKGHVRLNFKNHLKSTTYLQFKQSIATLEQGMASGFNNVNTSKLKIFVSPQRQTKKIVSEIPL